jgi:hypothetical protein
MVHPAVGKFSTGAIKNICDNDFKKGRSRKGEKKD